MFQFQTEEVEREGEKKKLCEGNTICTDQSNQLFQVQSETISLNNFKRIR